MAASSLLIQFRVLPRRQSKLMSPAFYRRKAEQCRQIAAERPGTLCARYLIDQANEHEQAASILIELRKINAALPSVVVPLVRRRESLH